MFIAPKFARLSADAAKKMTKTGTDYDLGKLDAAVKRGDLRFKDNVYLHPIDVPVIGCGTELPANHNPENRGSFEAKSGDEALDRLHDDVDAVVNSFGLTFVVDAFNNGLDLATRGGVFRDYKRSQRKVSDAEKIGWIAVNRPEEIKAGRAVQEYVSLYDSIHSESDSDTNGSNGE